MTKKDLMALRAEKENAMANIVETRGESMDAEALETLKTFKAEIVDIDNRVEAIDELRSVALKNSAPVEVKKADAQADLSAEFRSYVAGKTSLREYENRAQTLVANGSNIVPEVFVKDLQEKVLEFGSLYSSVSKMSTSHNGQVSIPTINDTGNSGVWTDEGGAYSTADFSSGTITMDAHKITTGIQVSDELLQDSFFNIESYLASAFAERLSRTIESAIVDGDGVKKPEGIIGDASTKSFDSAAAGVVDSTDILTAIFELQPTARQNAVIYVSDDLMKDLSLEVDSIGRPLLQLNASATVADKIKYTIGGYPVVVNYGLAEVATGSVSALIGDPKAYMVRNVQGFTIKRDEFSGMGTGMVNFYCAARLDGKILNVNDGFVKIVTA